MLIVLSVAPRAMPVFIVTKKNMNNPRYGNVISTAHFKLLMYISSQGQREFMTLARFSLNCCFIRSRMGANEEVENTWEAISEVSIKTK